MSLEPAEHSPALPGAFVDAITLLESAGCPPAITNSLWAVWLGQPPELKSVLTKEAFDWARNVAVVSSLFAAVESATDKVVTMLEETA